MLSNHKIQIILEEIGEISKMDLALYDERGRKIAATYEPADMKSVIVDFASSMAESQMLGGCHFFKVAIEGETEFILLVRNSMDEAYMVGRLAVCQIRNLILASRELSDKNNLMQNILLGNMLVVDIYNKAKKLHIEQAKRIVYVIEVDGKKDTVILETVKNLFAVHALPCVSENSILAFKDKGLGDEFAVMWDIILSLLRADWFLDCADSCVWQDEDGEEDILFQSGKA